MPRFSLYLIIYSLTCVLPLDDPLWATSAAAPSVNGAAALVNGSWAKLVPPTGRTDHTAIYDPVRHRVVVFGGYRTESPTHMNDVWALSLTDPPTWTKLTPSGTPPTGRRNHTAIYDSLRDRMIVFGGFGSASPNYRSDVWALSLTDPPTWTQLLPAGTPPTARRSHTALYDPVADRMVVFGGYESASPNYRNDVWTLSLAATPAWTLETPSGSPPSARAEHVALYDAPRGRMIVIGGFNGTYLNDTWTLSLGPGPAWSEIAAAGTPLSVRAEHAAVYDPVEDRVLVFGEWDGFSALLNDVASLSLGGTPTWTQLVPAGARAAGRWGHSAIYDPVGGRMIVFGGLPNYANDTWAFSLTGSNEWDELAPMDEAPAGRWFHAAAYDPVRDRVIASGGYPTNIHDVWALSLGGPPQWTRLQPSGTPPSGRKNHSLIYDPVRDRMLMFGGFLTYPDNVGLVLYQNDLWALSLGQSPAWTLIVPAGNPPGIRDEHSAIYDPVQDRMIVFGGHAGGFNYNDVWELSLGENPTWTQLFPTGTPPSPRRRHNAIRDPLRNEMVVFGGYDTVGLSCVNDVWTLSLGQTMAWTQVFPAGTPPSPRGRQAAIYDPLRDRMVISGGFDCSPAFKNDVWELSLGSNPAWTQLSPGTPPSIRGGHSTIYDPVRDRMVLFAGGTGYFQNDVWTLTWGETACAIPEIASYAPAVLTPENCAANCIVDFTIDTANDYSGVTKVILERYHQGAWIREDSLIAPLLPPPWTLSRGFDQYFPDGEHVFHAVFQCTDGSRGFSETATVVADRGVPVAIGRVDVEYSRDGVVLRWSGDEAAAVRGFNVYRSAYRDAGFDRIDAQIVSTGRGYVCTDRNVSPGTTYWYRLGALDGDEEWMSPVVSITVPSFGPTLGQNVPNPFHPTTLISFAVPARSRVTLRIYDVAGRHVKTLLDDEVDIGVRNVVWDGTDQRGNRVGSGVYFYQMRTGGTVLTKTMVRLK